MNTSFLYHVLGVREQDCSRVRYEDNNIIFDNQTPSGKLRYSCCQSCHIIRSGYHFRRIHCIPMGSKQAFLNMKVQRVECRDCDCIHHKDVHFLTGKRAYMNRFARLVIELSRIGIIQDVACFYVFLGIM